MNAFIIIIISLCAADISILHLNETLVAHSLM